MGTRRQQVQSTNRLPRAVARLALSAAALTGAALLAPAAWAADYWVDAGHGQASDSNPGTEASPWLTIQHAADVAVAGDVVHVKPGTYEEHVRLSTAGADASPITFRAEPRREAFMGGFTIDGADWTVVEGFDITRLVDDPAWDETEGFFVGASHVEILDNYIHDVPSTAIGGYWHDPYPNDVRVADNSIYRVQQGIGIQGADWVVERNEVVRLFQYGEGDCDYMRFFGTGHVIRHNVMYGTDFGEIGDAHVDCFQTFTNNDEVIHDILFDGNVCHDFHQGLMASNVNGTDTRDFTFVNNVFSHGGAWGICVHDVSGIRLFNNTFVDIAYHGAGFRGASTGNVARNNIFAFVSTSYWGDEGGEVTGDYNLVYESSDPGTPGANDLLGEDPLFIDRDADDYRLDASSPAVDSGETIAEVTTDLMGTPRPQGAGYDRGAWEYLDTPPLMIVTMSLPEGMLAEPYDAALVATGGTPPYSWSILTGSLPDGLTLDPQSGALTGTPTLVGGETFEAQVADQDGTTDARELTIIVRGETTVVPEAQAGSSDDDGGCGCRLAPRDSRTPSGAAATWLAVAAALAARTRRRRAPTARAR